VRKNGDGYHYLVSRGEWTEGFSLGILAKHDKGGALRGALGGFSASTWQNFVSKTKIEPKKLYHVGMTFDGQFARLFVNGVCETSADLGKYSRVKYERTGLWLGGEALGLGEKYSNLAPRHFLDGQIAGLEMLRRTKNEAEVMNEYQAGPPEGCF
jgi:hypothetical protein